MPKHTGPIPEGSRVRIVPCALCPNGGVGRVRRFPDDVRSDLSQPPHSPDEFEADGLVRRVAVFDRPYVSQWVVYEQPAPAIAGEIELGQLELLKESGDD